MHRKIKAIELQISASIEKILIKNISFFSLCFCLQRPLQMIEVENEGEIIHKERRALRIRYKLRTMLRLLLCRRVLAVLVYKVKLLKGEGEINYDITAAIIRAILLSSLIFAVSRMAPQLICGPFFFHLLQIEIFLPTKLCKSAMNFENCCPGKFIDGCLNGAVGIVYYCLWVEKYEFWNNGK